MFDKLLLRNKVLKIGKENLNFWLKNVLLNDAQFSSKNTFT
jgi:hypothetical protein